MTEEKKLLPDPDLLDDDDLDEPLVEGWKCDNDEKAEWCLRMIKSSEEEIKRWEAHYAAQLEKIRTYHQRRIDTMTTYLRRYLLQQREAGLVKQTKTQVSYKLPGGTLRLKQGSWEYQRDDEQLCAWLQSSDMTELIKIKTSPDWAGLKKLTMTTDEGKVVLAETGEVIPGVTAAMKPDSFVVEDK